MLETMKAAIFDMDGTLIDSMPAWRRLNSEFVRSHGIEPTPEQDAEMLQITGIQMIEYYKKHFGIETDFDTLCALACDQMEAVYRAGVPHKPGIQAYLRRLRARGVKCVVATASPARLALTALNTAGLVPDLDYIYSTDMIGGHKGQIEFYDRLSALIGVPREECVMFEDALYAMQGAKAAGLGVVGVKDSTNVRDWPEICRVCDVTITSYDELK